MAVLCEHGADISGATAARPTNVEIGQRFYDTTTGTWYVYGNTGWESVGGNLNVVAVVAAGANQGNATALTTGSMNLVTAADGAKGVKLPTAAADSVVEVFNDSASNLLVYPNTSDDINNGTVNVHVVMAAGTYARFVAVDAVTWSGIYSAGGTYATLTGAESLTNKTLTSPVIGTGLTASGSAANTFAGSTGTFLTSTGLNTIGGKMAQKVIATPVAATGAGGGVAGAAALGSANIVVVSSDGATKGVKFLAGVAGDVIEVINSSATACNLFAASGGTINGGAADAGCTIPASKGVLGICTAADTWTVYDLPAKAGAAA